RDRHRKDRGGDIFPVRQRAGGLQARRGQDRQAAGFAAFRRAGDAFAFGTYILDNDRGREPAVTASDGSVFVFGREAWGSFRSVGRAGLAEGNGGGGLLPNHRVGRLGNAAAHGDILPAVFAA